MCLSDRLMEVISGAQEAAAEAEETRWAEREMERRVKDAVFERLCEGESVWVLRAWQTDGGTPDEPLRSMTFIAKSRRSLRRRWAFVVREMSGRPWKWRLDNEKMIRFGTKFAESGEFAE